ncbi:hypothetical protein L227DRAFT_572116 [Lentinus tigrinus ALCF2SS1-6]|uniref:Uncharacterized protein n=1 Tax=Lentinus tigrinus ALCF2SS1-6 TaxID=1328759 RepID=A0A5C2SKM5_9APHY|nr:hypothetical protein L227DRAFT_572116 [Lentinus tigrinus ALCF2SS1-6]
MPTFLLRSASGGFERGEAGEACAEHGRRMDRLDHLRDSEYKLLVRAYGSRIAALWGHTVSVICIDVFGTVVLALVLARPARKTADDMRTYSNSLSPVCLDVAADAGDNADDLVGQRPSSTSSSWRFLGWNSTTFQVVGSPKHPDAVQLSRD